MSEEVEFQSDAAAQSVVNVRDFGPMVIPIDGPLSITFDANRMDINIVMAIAGQVDGIQTALRLTPEATGQLVGAIKKAIDEQLITITVGSPKALN